MSDYQVINPHRGNRMHYRVNKFKRLLKTSDVCVTKHWAVGAYLHVASFEIYKDDLTALVERCGFHCVEAANKEHGDGFIGFKVVARLSDERLKREGKPKESHHVRSKKGTN